ncbi:LytTR family DNA-binding domain-containing protein [Parabacteroides segnis]|jgi:DNA-binding LytR/AlgR family response regulator|uniref:Response regulator transcription factor n=1 Tax=Parabacteroides segnis TaxID=2763058 RepID=A0ABR7E1F2_9BACT|nr:MULTISPECIES: LytTR family DNA-binding domain-containing protein [Parabacteroides]MBC5643587.1 response regulator transcription factor [Parabacteroides segnis]MCM0713575.1 LytTR family DNA-binding domain-containing protein [Parabacteroides sp. TA-V-105]
MKVLIIEDEQPAAHKLIRLLEEADKQIEVIDVLASIEQTINWLAVHPGPELIFMDIQLEDGISFEIFETCKIQTPVIFTTAYDEYTLKAFKVNSIDYLLKPIAPDDLKAALDKFNVLHRQQANYSRLESIISQLQPKTKERFLIKIGEHYRSVQTLSIHCFFIMERNTFIQTDTGKTYPIDYSLDKIEQLVDPGQFFRINRNFIVNFSAIQDILIYSSGRLKIILNGWTEKEDILVSRERVTEFKEWMDR